MVSPSAANPALASRSSPGSPSPSSAASSAASSSGSSASSASVLTSRKIGSAGATRAVSSFRWSSARPVMSVLNTYRNGLAVSNCSSRRSLSLIPASAAPCDNVVPWLSSRCAAAAASATRSRSASLENFTSLASRGKALSSVWRSANINSVEMISTSRAGSTSPSTWLTSGSSNTRTTWQIASVSRMCARNLLPRPCPSDAPRTRPAMSTKRTVAGTILAEELISASTLSRGSGMPTMPTLGSTVAKA